MSEESEFPIRLHLHLHRRAGHPFPPLELHLYDSPEPGPAAGRASYAAEKRPEGGDYNSDLTIDYPASGSTVDVTPDASGSETGYISNVVVEAATSDAYSDTVYARIYRPDDTLDAEPPSDAVSVGPDGSGKFQFSKVEGAYYSSGGTANVLCVWGVVSGKTTCKTSVTFTGVPASSFGNVGLVVTEMGTTLPVQSDRYGVQIERARNTGEGRRLAAALKQHETVLKYVRTENLGLRQWRARAHAPLGEWLLQLHGSNGRISATLILSDFDRQAGVTWNCEEWNGEDQNIFVPINPPELRTRLPRLLVVPR